MKPAVREDSRFFLKSLKPLRPRRRHVVGFMQYKVLKFYFVLFEKNSYFCVS